MLRTVVLLGLAAAATVLPLLRLPRPAGPYAVGTVTLQGTAPEVQIWYPAVPGSRGKRASYAPAGATLNRRLLRLARTRSIADATLAPGRFPVLIYVNGWGGARWENTALVQDLASRGYVVAAADQPASSADGDALTEPMDMSSPAAWASTQQRAEAKLRAQVAGLRGLLDRLEALNGAAQDRFGGRLDLTRVGVVGFSFGGATVAEAASVDPRLRAVVNMDGLLFGTARRRGVAVPYLELSDDTPPAEAPVGASIADRTLADVLVADDAATRANLARNGGVLLTIAGTLHANFSDYPLLVPLRRINAAGPIDPHLAARIIAVAVAGFFDHALKGAALPNLAGFSPVRLESWPSPASPAAPAGAPR